MKSRTKLSLVVITILFLVVGLSRFTLLPKHDFSKTFSFEFESSSLSKIIQKDLKDQKGTLAVYVENLTSGEKYSYQETMVFPAASLYKLVLMAAVLREVEAGQLKLEDNIVGTKSHLIQVLGEEDFGYEDVPEKIVYTTQEALERVGRISDNFAAIMLTEKLRQVREARAGDDKLLIQMAQDLGMSSTSFENDPIDTTALDIATYFKKLHNGQIISPQVSEQIANFLLLSKINDRIPAKLPDGLKIVHKTGELSRVRHDAGIVYLENDPYVIVLLSKDLQYEDDGIETSAQISYDVYDYFKGKQK